MTFIGIIVHDYFWIYEILVFIFRVPSWLHFLGFKVLGKIFERKNVDKFGPPQNVKLRMNGILHNNIRDDIVSPNLVII